MALELVLFLTVSCVSLQVSKISARLQPHPRHSPGLLVRSSVLLFLQLLCDMGPLGYQTQFKGHLLEKRDDLLMAEEILLHVRGKY